jgi:hypothetical protein
MAINLENWGSLFKIPIEYTPSEATAGQMLVLTEKVLEKVPQMTQDLFWLNVKNGGGDIRLCENEDGTGQLPIEITLCDTVSRTLIIWYRLPVFVGLESLYLFYNNNSATTLPLTNDYGQYAAWQDFSFVSHNGLDDVTGNIVLTEVGSIPRVEGRLGEVNGATYFDGVENYALTSITPTRFYDNDGHSFRSWHKNDGVPSYANQGIVGIYDGDSTGDWAISAQSVYGSFGENTMLAWLRRYDNTGGYAARQGTEEIDYTNWHSSVSTFTNNERSIYVNGVLSATNTVYLNSSKDMDRFAIGAIADRVVGNRFKGWITEVWWEKNIPSEAKVNTEYANQSDNASFYGTPSFINLKAQLLVELDSSKFQLELLSNNTVYPTRVNTSVLKLRPISDSPLGLDSEGYVNFESGIENIEDLKVVFYSYDNKIELTFLNGDISLEGSSLVCDTSKLASEKFSKSYIPVLILYVEGDSEGLVISGIDDFISTPLVSVPYLSSGQAQSPSQQPSSEIFYNFTFATFEPEVPPNSEIFLGRSNTVEIRLKALNAEGIVVSDKGYLDLVSEANQIDKVEVYFFNSKDSYKLSSETNDIQLSNELLICYGDVLNSDFRGGSFNIGIILYVDGDTNGIVVGDTQSQMLGSFPVYSMLSNTSLYSLDDSAILDLVRDSNFYLDLPSNLWIYPHRSNTFELRIKVETGTSLLCDSEDNLLFLESINQVTKVALIIGTETWSSSIDSDSGDIQVNVNNLICRVGNLVPPQKVGNIFFGVVIYFGGDLRGYVVSHTLKDTFSKVYTLPELSSLELNPLPPITSSYNSYNNHQFNLIIEGDRIVYPERSNRTVFRLQPKSGVFELDQLGNLLFSSTTNNIQGVEVVLFNSKKVITVSNQHESMSVSGSRLICNLGLVEDTVILGEYYIGVVLYIGSDTHGYVAYNTLSELEPSNVISFTQSRL